MVEKVSARTLIVAGLLGSVFMFGLLFVPGVRDPERMPRPEEAVPRAA